MDTDNVLHVNLDRCFGCGVCASGCPEGAITMVNKENFPPPPKTTRDLVLALKNSSTEKKG
jgi:Fe-S-cluster-containing hydrogenase component 2